MSYRHYAKKMSDLTKYKTAFNEYKIILNAINVFFFDDISNIEAKEKLNSHFNTSITI